MRHLLRSSAPGRWPSIFMFFTTERGGGGEGHTHILQALPTRYTVDHASLEGRITDTTGGVSIGEGEVKKYASVACLPSRAINL